MRILRRKTKSKNVKGYDLVFCSSEDGLSVMNRNGGKHGHSEVLARISPNRVVSFYRNDIPNEIRERIVRFAENDDWAYALNDVGDCRCR